MSNKDYISYDEKVAMSLLKAKRENGENERQAQYRESDAIYQKKMARKWLLAIFLGMPVACLIFSLTLRGFGIRYLIYLFDLLPFWMVHKHNVCVDAYRVAARKNLPIMLELLISLLLYVAVFVYIVLWNIIASAAAPVVFDLIFS